MATITNLSFVEKKGVWEALLTSPGPCVVQVDRKTGGSLSVSANVDGMREVAVRVLYNQNSIFKLEFPAGIKVTIRSWSEVDDARIFVE